MLDQTRCVPWWHIVIVYMLFIIRLVLLCNTNTRVSASIKCGCDVSGLIKYHYTGASAWIPHHFHVNPFAHVLLRQTRTTHCVYEYKLIWYSLYLYDVMAGKAGMMYFHKGCYTKPGNSRTTCDEWMFAETASQFRPTWEDRQKWCYLHTDWPCVCDVRFPCARIYFRAATHVHTIELFNFH